MNNTTKFNSPSSLYSDNSSIVMNARNVASFQRILYGRPPPTTPRTEQSHVIETCNINEHTKDPSARSILIDSATRQSGFLPHEYRLANTFESIRRRRSEYKSSLKPSKIIPRTSFRTSPRLDAFGNLTSTMSKLAEQRLILRQKSIKKKPNSSPVFDKQEGHIVMSDADFATDIPNALEFVLQNSKGKTTMELNLFETLKRERLEQARYRLLPINRAPYT
ncbi:unnamed protein product [Rotaria sordida]|uniref:Uncharacterized protein n=1 Tax=Rotaria sordida TaxID=392033 RepID=A0A814LH79_9BILA|nr:unnamed protein product [Rotaria sordida]CAF1064213.1 unnamed protein product [Rotaria sordida]CAF3532555.1 unnamed protein product [Rotaria sordida]CAF3574579.1 unnamed protein product [Rotaria sordida]